MNRDKIAALAQKSIYFGTSSWKYEGWKYEGWKELVYHRPYKSDKQFNEECLTEYSGIYSTVGVDHTYYAWPSPTTFEKYVDQTPEHFLFGLKATERVTVFQYPKLKRYGKDAGKINESFLDANLFAENFLAPLEPFKDRIGPIMFEFSQFYPGMIASGGEFIERLEKFLESLRRHEGFQFSVEMRNQNWLKAPYFEMLERQQTGHVFNSWTRMPAIEEQLVAAENFKPPVYVARLLLEPGTKYEEAVEAYSPYRDIQNELPSVRAATAKLVVRAIQFGVPAYVFVNNRCEGCAPKTIDAILDLLKEV